MANKQENNVDGSEQAYKDFVNEFLEESDRACVVLGAAKLDISLFQILQKRLLPCGSGKDELFDADSPLSTFSAKINLCHRLGLIDSEVARSLHLIRKIRNAFAHEISGVSLSSGSHADRVKELVTSYRDLPAFKMAIDMAHKKIKGASSGTPLDFRIMLAFLIAHLDVLYQRLDVIERFSHPSFSEVMKGAHKAMEKRDAASKNDLDP